ncbi:alpha/beta hydrolase [Labrenzia sp. OB1]|uniref:alpha/beta hydrolase n=1 Tax=Labrenzia sp. OB1 TaxID=1561204 RepID=UPI0007B26B82|nr:alpha/beta hydrolase [Labrenzia sp. OB1]KZM51834.1 esterase [Labrenzia sp. OB1]
MSLSFYHALTKKPAPGAPLVLAFHGTGGDEHQFSQFVDETLPEAGLVSPRGDVSEHGALRFFRRTGEGVYDMDDLAFRTGRMVSFIAAHKEANPGHPVYAFGYSNGANILASVAFIRPGLFDRVALLHPLIPWTPEANAGLAGKDILITAGHRDPICPPQQTAALISWLEDQKAVVSAELHDGGHEIRQQEVTALQAFLTDQIGSS